jgi:uncharacterized protein (DUF4415 family)
VSAAALGNTNTVCSQHSRYIDQFFPKKPHREAIQSTARTFPSSGFSRVDHDVFEWSRSTGKGYQSFMSEGYGRMWRGRRSNNDSVEE